MARFTQYPTASTGDYADATTFLIANSDGEIKQASLEGLRDIFGSSIQSTSLSIASADVLQLNSTPLTIVAAQGAGTVIEVVSAFVGIDFNTAAYASSTTLYISCDGATDPQYVGGTVLNATLTSNRKLVDQNASAATDTQLIENTDLVVSVPTGNPTAGDSDITVRVLYRVITL